MRFRRLHRWYAHRFGFFWLPCPLCGQMFGGHEWRDIDGKVASIPTGRPGHTLWYEGEGICPDCTAAGRGSWSSELEV
jgi:hypothetical protein